MVRFLVIRHGETEWNRLGRIQGQLESPLNERGLEQAQALANVLEQEEIHELWSSDLDRARDTAAHVADVSGERVRIDTRLRERHFGVFQGLTFEQAEQRYPEYYEMYTSDDPDESIPGGESPREFQDRTTSFFIERGKDRDYNHKTIAVVTHGGVVSALYRLAKGISLTAQRTWELPNAAINEFHYDRGKWRIARFGDVSHLEEALDEL
jgi:2,3-bisphosphoglycerate-dependent phosphoglycerate mutase